MASRLSDAQQLRALTEFAAGASTAAIAETLAVPVALVDRLVMDVANLSRDRAKQMARTLTEQGVKPAPDADAVPGDVMNLPMVDLLERASKASLHSVRNRAARIYSQVDTLRRELVKYERLQPARAQVKHLEDKLRQAKQALQTISQLERELKEARAELKRREAEIDGTPASEEPAADVPAADVPAWQVREWAHKAGVNCPQRGTVPQAVRQAYADAHQVEVADAA